MRSKGDNERLAAIEALFQQLASRVGGTLAKDRALRWFDGFWDFVVPNREALERRRSRQLEGTYDGLPWLLLCWEDLAADEPMHLDLFVEVRSPPGHIAPPPVTTIRMVDGCRVELPTSPTNLQRPHDMQLATTLDRAGFHVEVVRWGVRVAARDLARLLRDGISALESSFMAALRLAQSMAKAERYLPGYGPNDSSSG